MGSVLRLHHGLSVGMALPYTIEFNCQDNEEAASQYSELAAILGIKGTNDAKTSMKLAAAVRDLMKKVGSPASFKEAGVKKKDFKDGLEKLVEFAMMDSSLTMNPRNTDSNEIRKLYEYMFEGKIVDF
jgi:alcohol dehydrogenase class IV